MTQEQRKEAMRRWLKDCSSLHETRMPNEARFFVGQGIVHEDRHYEVIGFYAYDGGKFPCYLAIQVSGPAAGSLTGIPLTIQGEMHLESEHHKYARIIRMTNRFKKH